MIPTGIVTTITFLYFVLLFSVAYYADQRRKSGRSLISNPNIYALSLAVYCSSWTFYGSVGRAATSGLDFIAIYVGPTLIAFAWWFLLRKMVRISKEQNIVTIADFISSRYGKSVFLGVVVTIFAIIGITPYIALQLKAIAHTFNLIALSPPSAVDDYALQFPTFIDTALFAAIILGVFGVLFGARNLDATDRHEGLVAAVAFESLVKLVAFLSVGIFVTYGIFDGFGDIFSRFLARFPERADLLLLNTEKVPYSTWFTLTFVSMMAFMFLPRQFHIMVIENSQEDHIKSAMWQFPTYLFLINLFVIPIALGGLLLFGGDNSAADYFVISIPLQANHPWLALFVFIGGFSAAAGMVMISSVSLATMILNHLVMPIILRIPSLASKNLSRTLINIKRSAIMAVVLIGYIYYKIIGDSYALVNIGLISFIAATQFAPAMIGGIYWRQSTRFGASTGMIAGFTVWFYTLLIPAFCRSNWLSNDIIDHGLFGITLLKPLELFGLSGFDMWTHSLFWTLFFNLGCYLTISLLSTPSATEREQVHKFVDVFSTRVPQIERKRFNKAPSLLEFVELMAKFIGEKQAHAAISEYLGDRDIDEKGSVSENELLTLKSFAERTLAGSVGAAPARIIIDNYLVTRGSTMEDVFDIFGSVTLSRTSSREQLSVLYESARAVSGGDNLNEILDNILHILRQQFKFDLCTIRLLDEERSLLTVIAQDGMSTEHFDNADRDLTMDNYVGATFLTNKETVINDVELMKRSQFIGVIQREGIKSFAHMPITIEGQPIGVLSVFSKSVKGIFTPEFIELFHSLAVQIGIAKRNADQTEHLIAAHEQQKELQIAKNIQLGLLPLKAPDIAGIDLAGICVPARQVGGDYYDILPTDRNTIDLVIADVSGHNVGAALIMAETRTFIHSKINENYPLSVMLNQLNEFFHDDLSRAELFVTMFYLRYILGKRTLTYTNAGHNKPLLWRKATEECEHLDTEGMILGIKRNVIFEEHQTVMQPGDILLLYTDGIVEAENSQGDFFGIERLSALLNEHHTLQAQQMIDTIMQQVRLFTGLHSFVDDISLLIMKVTD